MDPLAVQARDPERVYNTEALARLLYFLFDPASPVGQIICAHWTQYAHGSGTPCDKLTALFRAIFESPVKLEITETYLQVLESPSLRIPRDQLEQYEAIRMLIHGMSGAFRTARRSLTSSSVCKCYIDYKYNDLLDSQLDRYHLATSVVGHMLAYASGPMYYATRNLIHTAAVGLQFEYYTQTQGVPLSPACNRIMDALTEVCAMTALHSPIIRAASPEEVRARLSHSADSAQSPLRELPPSQSGSPSSVFHISRSSGSNFGSSGLR